MELLRLRGEVGRLRNAERELVRLRGEAARLAAAEGTNSSVQDPASPGSPPFFFVGGEFALPNRFLWTNGMTLAGAIALAHGFTDAADRSAVQIKDPSGVVVATFNCAEPLDPQVAGAFLQPGDKVVVLRAQ
jgi:hypothetical protein